MTESDVTLTFHGAAETVSGSCLELVGPEFRILVDCGLFQGSRSLERLNLQPFNFEPAKIDAVLLTHAHIDHSGLLPRLVSEGFAGTIWCTRPSKDLLKPMLADAGGIQEMDAERRNRRRDRAGEVPFAPIYTERDAQAAWRLCKAASLNSWIEPAPGLRARFWNAGHILGSASIEVDLGGVHALFSGDLGPDHKAFLADPEGPSGFDYVVCESTYGARRRVQQTLESRRISLQAEVTEGLAKGGNVVIPAFALERTQELLLDLVHLVHRRAIPQVPVFIDSPLASQITEVFAHYAGQLQDTGGTNIFADPAVHFVASTAQSIRLNSVSGAIILSASGMCEGGRIRHHLLHNLCRRDSTVLFVGYQAQGTLGRILLDGAKTVRISGCDVRVRAAIRRIDSYSAHADQGELLDWISRRGPISGTVFLNHGEVDELEDLCRVLHEKDPALEVRIPRIGEVYSLRPGRGARRLKTGRLDAQRAVGRDWQNAYAELATGLKSDLEKVPSEHRQEAIGRLREVLRSYSEFRDHKRA